MVGVALHVRVVGEKHQTPSLRRVLDSVLREHGAAAPLGLHAVQQTRAHPAPLARALGGHPARTVAVGPVLVPSLVVQIVHRFLARDVQIVTRQRIGHIEHLAPEVRELAPVASFRQFCVVARVEVSGHGSSRLAVPVFGGDRCPHQFVYAGVLREKLAVFFRPQTVHDVHSDRRIFAQLLHRHRPPIDQRHVELLDGWRVRLHVAQVEVAV
mmetsp:Transcript_13966/g.34523  ORF Transcript_13966/g.34523 Transcript_13966/m.34523 type:complete len:212 (-) Transcript_13966:1366-2001(-)